MTTCVSQACQDNSSRQRSRLPRAAAVSFPANQCGAMTLVTADDAVRSEFDVPGFRPEDIRIDLDDGLLTVSGTRPRRSSEGRVLHSERGSDEFRRVLRLDEALDPSTVEAVVRDGVLTVTIAKKPEAQPVRISVRDGSAAT